MSRKCAVFIAWACLAGFGALPGWAQSPSPGGVRWPDLPSGEAPSPAEVSLAQEAYAKASELYYQGEVDRALPHAEEAFELLPNASTALVVATIHAEGGQPCDAMDHGLLALDLGPTPAERDATVELLAEVASKCTPGWGWMTIGKSESPRPNITVRAASVPPGRTIAVVAGNAAARIDFGVRGTVSRESAIEVGVGSVLEIPAAPPAQPPVPEPGASVPVVVGAQETADPSGDPTFETAGWALVGSGAAAAVVGGVLIGLAYDSANEANDLAGTTGDPALVRADYNDAKRRAEDFQVGGWVTGGVGLAAVTTGIVLLTLEPESADTVSIGPTWTQPGMWVRARF